MDTISLSKHPLVHHCERAGSSLRWERFLNGPLGLYDRGDILIPIAAKQKGARGDRGGLTPPDIPNRVTGDLGVVTPGTQGTPGLPLLMDSLLAMEPCSLLLPPHIPTHPKTCPCPNPDGPSSPVHCHLLPGRTLYCGEKPGAHLSGDEFALISTEDLLATLPSSHPSVLTPGSHSADLGGTGDVKSAMGAILHPRFRSSSSEPRHREGKQHASNIWP